MLDFWMFSPHGDKLSAAKPPVGVFVRLFVRAFLFQSSGFVQRLQTSEQLLKEVSSDFLF